MKQLISTPIYSKLVFGLLLLTYLSPATIAQNIPDVNFANAIRTACPTCIDGANNLLAPAAGLTELDVSYKNISNLAGIEGFTSLQWLRCDNNKITNILALPNDLKTLECGTNQLTTLPTLPNNLQVLGCSINNLTNSSLSNLPSNLKKLYCFANQISVLPPLPANLQVLWCSSNPISVLPSLPNSLELLICNGCQLTKIPTLPQGLTWLDCGSNKQITSLPDLPSSLEILFCEGNQLTSLPTLPQTLKKLACNDQFLTALPALPNTLEELTCSHNQIATLPTLSENLKRLSCDGNQLTMLPTLPNRLNSLSCSNPKLNTLPSLPATLEFLFCNGSDLSALPLLPNGLKVAWILYNKITCLPPLPNSLTSIVLDSDDITCVPNQVQGLMIKNAFFVEITLPTCTTFAPTLVSGATPSTFTPINVGNTVTFKAKATGAGALNVKWQRKGAAEADFVDINGTFLPYTANTDATYTTPALTALDNNATYRAVFKAGCSVEVNSASAQITVADPSNIASIASGDWNNPTTWSCNCVPSPTSNVTIKAGSVVVLTSTMGVLYCKNLTVETGAIFEVKGVFLADPR
jgi:Leucine-rich repeat (LRR) protein